MQHFIVSSLLGLLVGCAQAPLPPLEAHHPASASAAEGIAYVSAHHDDDEHDHASEGGTYTCPMHADVVSDKPGSCPKCGMHLVPKKKETP